MTLTRSFGLRTFVTSTELSDEACGGLDCTQTHIHTKEKWCRRTAEQPNGFVVRLKLEMAGMTLKVAQGRLRTIKVIEVFNEGVRTSHQGDRRTVDEF